MLLISLYCSIWGIGRETNAIQNVKSIRKNKTFTALFECFLLTDFWNININILGYIENYQVEMVFNK